MWSAVIQHDTDVDPHSYNDTIEDKIPSSKIREKRKISTKSWVCLIEPCQITSAVDVLL